MMKIITKELKKERDCKGYLLGVDSDNENIYLRLPSWDCGHYWGCGYVGNGSFHSHFKGHIIGQQKKYNFEKEVFENTKYTHHLNEVLKESVLNDSESWVLSELMSSIEILTETSEFFNRGGSNYTKNPLRKELINDKMYKEINKILLPKLFKEVDKLLRGKNQKEIEFKLLDSEINVSSGGRY